MAGIVENAKILYLPFGSTTDVFINGRIVQMVTGHDGLFRVKDGENPVTCERVVIAEGNLLLADGGDEILGQDGRWLAISDSFIDIRGTRNGFKISKRGNKKSPEIEYTDNMRLIIGNVIIRATR